MVKEIVKDVEVLKQKSRAFDEKTDMDVIQDLLDTIRAHKDEAAGLAAIQIGYPVKALAMRDSTTNQFVIIVNPRIIKKDRPYTSTESCLSLEGERKVQRYKRINVVVTYVVNGKLKTTAGTFVDFEAKVLQHECDHFEGKLI